MSPKNLNSGKELFKKRTDEAGRYFDATIARNRLRQKDQADMLLRAKIDEIINTMLADGKSPKEIILIITSRRPDKMQYVMQRLREKGVVQAKPKKGTKGTESDMHLKEGEER